MKFRVFRSVLAGFWLQAWLCSFFLLVSLCHSPASQAAKVVPVPLPDKALVPDACVDAHGILHVVYGLDHNAWYVRSSDNGKTFSTPAKVNSTGTVETEMGERGPKLALGKDGSIHFVWVDDWAPGVKTWVRYSRSVDGGKSFEPVRTVSSNSGVDGATLAADDEGHVAAFWHVIAEPKPTVKSATWLHMATSRDNGETFSPATKVHITNLSGLACSMCMMRARCGSDGKLYLAFRSAEESIRDFYVLKGDWEQNQFAAHRVNEDNWKIDFCPMCGPELTFTPHGQGLCAFMSRNKVYWAMQSTGAAEFKLHVPTPLNEKDEIYPSAIMNRAGEVLFLWQVGPMAVKGTATVKWAIYDKTGKPSGESGTIGQSFAGTKATAFVGADNNFYILTTAR